MLAPIGGFGGLFQIDLKKYKNPVMVSSIDGVGTKLMVAMMMEKYDSVGYDIVNHCIDDIAVQGAEPIYFMDYLGIGKLRSPLYEQVLGGIADACKAAGCAVLGGETAEMPGMYGDDFDLVGVINGIVDKDKLITGEKIKAGYAAVGLASSGLHTNGYSLARKVLFEKAGYNVHSTPEELNGESVGEALLKPHTCYWPAIKQALDDENIDLDGMAHITGGGLYDNVPRILPEDVDVLFDKNALPIPPVFKLIVEKGSIDPVEAYRVFNMGIGMVWFVPAEQADAAVKICKENGFNAAVCGKVVKGNRKVTVN
jgi:phosphoribosylformylglycinamidine cyclo-ligase